MCKQTSAFRKSEFERQDFMSKLTDNFNFKVHINQAISISEAKFIN